ncbi:uncharacterized protein [Dermacentor albipictus]|uniref:uncharacterized protein n=1 Tax=Dermacentor albipictus TaxID=60249 RepID=UPI0038FD2234
MLPIVAILLAVAVFLISAATIAWLYLRLIRQMSWDDHKGSYQPSKTEEKVLGKSLSLLNGTAKVAAFDETDNKDVEAAEEQPSDSSVTLLSVTPREPEDGPALNGSFAEFDQSQTASGTHSSENHPMTSTPADGLSAGRYTRPQVPTAYVGRGLSYASATHTDLSERKVSDTSRTNVPDKQATRLNEPARSHGACASTAATRRENATGDVEELSLSPMLWDYAGFEWPGKNREDVFATDVDVYAGSECSGTAGEEDEEEEESDGHSSTSGVHRGARKRERSYSCYPFVEHGPRQVQDYRCVPFVQPEYAAVHCSAASSGSLPISEEDEADQAFFGKAQHDESYRQYLRSIILKRKARMYYGLYGDLPYS